MPHFSMNEMTSAQTQLTSRRSIVGRVTTLRAERYGVLMQVGAGNVLFFKTPRPTMSPPPSRPPIQLVFPRLVRRPGHDVNNSYLPSAEAENEWIYTSTLPGLYSTETINFTFSQAQ